MSPFKGLDYQGSWNLAHKKQFSNFLNYQHSSILNNCTWKTGLNQRRSPYLHVYNRRSCFFCFYVWSGLDLLGSLIAQLWNLPAMSQFSRKNATEWRQERFQLEFCEWIKHAESCAWLAKSSGDVSTYSSCTLSHPATEPHSGLTQAKLLLGTHV